MSETSRSHSTQPQSTRPEKGAPEDRSTWQLFVTSACAATGVDASLVDIDTVLDLAKQIAHSGARPMAPVSAFILGLAVGGGGGDPVDLRRRIERAAASAPVPDAPGGTS